MHVVQALASLTVGGSELVAAELTQHLVREGHRVTLLSSGGPLAASLKDDRIDWLDWPVGKKRLSTWKLVGRFAQWLEQKRPDVVHAHSRLPAWVCFLAIRRLEPKHRPLLVTSVHGQYTVSPYSAIMARGHRVIAVSRFIEGYILENYQFVDPKCLHVICGGVNTKRFPYGHKPSTAWYDRCYQAFPELEGKRLLLLPARLSRYKGHSSFIELMTRLRPEFEDVHGVIVGPGRPGSRYQAELEGLAERGGILDRISFTGLQLDMRDWMAASSIVFNLCSDPPEAFGRTVAEALKLGVPVIAWDQGGVHETLASLFPAGAVPGDHPLALREKTRQFLHEPPTVAPSEAFELEESLSRTLDLYRSGLEDMACRSS